MDQPYSRIADSLLDYQYWSPDDPQKTPYDDTAWTFGELFGVQVTRVTDPKILSVSVDRVTELPAFGGATAKALSSPSTITPNPLSPLFATTSQRNNRCRRRTIRIGGHKFSRGTFLIRIQSFRPRRRLEIPGPAAPFSPPSVPTVKTHPVRAPAHRLRSYLDQHARPKDGGASPRRTANPLRLHQHPGACENSRSQRQIRCHPVSSGRLERQHSTRTCRRLATSWGNPLPWLNTPETPNLSAKMIPRRTCAPALAGTASPSYKVSWPKEACCLPPRTHLNLPSVHRLANGMTAGNSEKLKIVGAIVGTRLVDSASPIAYGYDEKAFCLLRQWPHFFLNSVLGGPSSPWPGRRRSPHRPRHQR